MTRHPHAALGIQFTMWRKVAAGMMPGPQAGETATVVKLFRVLLLTLAVPPQWR